MIINHQEVINKLKLCSGLSIISLADVFLTDRKRLSYLRAENSLATDIEIERFIKIKNELERFSSKFDISAGSLFKSFVVDNVSLYQLLCRFDIDSDMVDKLAVSLADEMNKRNKAPLNKKISHQTTIDQLTKHS